MQAIWQDIYRILGLRGDLGDEALRFAGTWALKSRPNRIISQEDAAAELTQAAGTTLKGIAGIGEHLKAVVKAVHEIDNNVRLRAVTRIAQARFVATAILFRSFEPAVQADLLRKWERVTFRIYGLGGADSRYKVGDYVRLGYDILANNIGPEEIGGSLTALSKGYTMDDLILGSDCWLYCYDGWQEELRYLLFRYDKFLSKISGEKLNAGQWNKVWSEDPARSIEHILPQSSGADYVYHLGNLTMLPPNLNSSLKDKPRGEKAGTYLKCGLKATVAVGKQIENGTAWDLSAIEARAADVEAFVRKEWAN